MTATTSNLLVVIINGKPIIEYNREKKLSKSQQESLTLLQEKLSKGISLDGEFIAQPKLEQRIQFVAANLISALLNDQESHAALSCAYIATSLVDLKQVQAQERNGEVSIELIFDREFQEETKLDFVPLDKLTSQEH